MDEGLDSPAPADEATDPGGVESAEAKPVHTPRRALAEIQRDSDKLRQQSEALDEQVKGVRRPARVSRADIAGAQPAAALDGREPAAGGWPAGAARRRPAQNRCAGLVDEVEHDGQAEIRWI